MTRSKQKLSKAERARRRELREKKEDESLVCDMAATFTCLYELGANFAERCELSVEDIDFNLACAEIAAGFWADHPGTAQNAVAMMRELAAELAQHKARITDLAKRFATFSQEHSEHDAHNHLDPPEPYRAIIRARLYPDQ
jgi:hypothetical protein